MSNIVIFTSESVYSYILLGDFVTKYHESISSIYVSKSLKRQKIHKFFIKKIMGGLGFRYYLQRVFHNLKHKYKQRSIISLATKYSIPTIYTSNINDMGMIDNVRTEKPDVILSIYFDQIIKKDMLMIPSFGILNVHLSMLPKYRGVKPVFWVLKNNESTTGITIHMMDEDLDTGDILAQREVEISPDDTVDSLSVKMSEVGSKLLLDAMNSINSNSYTFKKQNFTCGSYYSQPTRKDLLEFIRLKHKFY